MRLASLFARSGVFVALAAAAVLVTEPAAAQTPAPVYVAVDGSMLLTHPPQ